MLRVSCICSLLIVGCSSPPIDEKAQSVVVKKLAQEVGDATLKGEYAKVIDSTYHTVVQQMGGREKAINATRQIMEQIKSQGFTIKLYDIGTPGAFLSEGRNTFVVIPTRTEMTFSGGRVITRSYLLGITSNAGKTWKFVDGTGISKGKGLRDKLLPKLPAKLKLPKLKDPEVIRGKPGG